MKIGLATSDWSLFGEENGLPAYGGAGWYRTYLPAQALREQGHEVVVGVLNSQRMVERESRAHVGYLLEVQEWELGQQLDIDSPIAKGASHIDCDVIVIQRYMHGPSTDIFGQHQPGLAEAIREGRKQGQIIVNDVDDWFFGLDPNNRAFLTTHPGVNPDHNIKLYREILGVSSALTVSTPYLRERFQAMFPKVRVQLLRNMIDVESFGKPRVQPKGKPTIGWSGATAWRSGDIETMRGLLPGFLVEHGLRFHHAGALAFRRHDGTAYGSFAEQAKFPESIQFTESPMVPTSAIPDLYRYFDVGIVPLAGKPFNMAKSAIKGMEYAAAGIPFVAAGHSEQVGKRKIRNEYYWAQEQGMGLVAERPADWKRCLTRLLDYETRRETAERGRAAVELQDYRVRGHEWADFYKSLL